MSQSESFIRPDEFWRGVGLRADQTVVHLGAGAGFYLIPAARIVGKRGHAIGIDILPDMLAEIENKARREGLEDIVKTIRADLEQPQGSRLPENSADWVLVANILYQSDPVKILHEAARVVAHNGRVVVVEWDTVASPLGPPTNQRIARDEALAGIEQAGLAVEKELRPSPYHYGFVLAKK